MENEMEDEKLYQFTGTTGTDYAAALFTELVMMLDRKGVISANELGQRLVENAAEVYSETRDDAALMSIRVLGQALIDVGSHPDAATSTS